MPNSIGNNSAASKTMKISDIRTDLQPLARQISGGKPEVSTTAIQDFIATRYKDVPFVNGNVDMRELMPLVNDDEFYAAEKAVELRDFVAEGDVFVPMPKPTALERVIGFVAPNLFNSTPKSIFNSEGLLRQWWK